MLSLYARNIGISEMPWKCPLGPHAGVCKGAGCACGASVAPSCGGVGAAECGFVCTGPPVPCCFGNNVAPLEPFYAEGTHAKLNYIAAYQVHIRARLASLDSRIAFVLPFCDPV